MIAFEPNLTGTLGSPRSQRRAYRKFEYLHALLAVGDGTPPSELLAQAYTLAGDLGAQLHVLRVLPRERPFLSSFMPEGHAVQSTRSVERCLTAASALRAWCDDVLPEAMPARRLQVRIGNLISETTASAARLERSLVLLPSETERLGATATALVRSTLRPVLVVRPPRRQGVVVVATDLEEDDSALEQSLAMGARLGSAVVALHNISCLSVSVSVPEPELVALAMRPGARGASSVRMGRVAERLSHSSTIVTNELSPVDAIVHHAHEQQARAIVVGTRSRSWFERLVEPSVAAAVVERAECSVLIWPCTQLRVP